MEVIFDIDNISNIKYDVGVTIGTFDGLHVGHNKVIKEIVKKCKQNNLKSVVYTFSNIPREIITGQEIKMIITLEEKVRLISLLDVDYLILIDFSKEFMNIEAKDFIKDILLDRLEIKHLVIGHDFKFGKNALGDINLLNQLKNYIRNPKWRF